jgi:glycosyltransferase involved in cell wall biosynthesis
MTPSTGRRLRVAIVSFDFAELCVPMANALAARADVALLMPGPVLEPFRADLSRAVHLETLAKPRLRQPLRQARMCRSLLRALDRFGPDVVHLQQGHLWFNLSLPLLRGPGLVVTIHDVEHHPGDRASQRTPQRILELGWARADEIIVHVEAVKRKVVERQGRDPAAVTVVPHIAIGSRSSVSNTTGDGRGVLFFGRIWPYKGLEHLINAQPLITERVPAARIVIAGRGEDLQRYRDMMHDPSRFVVIDEFVTNERRSELFAQAAVVVLPYVEASQSGVVPIAYAFEKPVIVTAVGGLPETVEDGRTGLVVPPRDERALADAISRLLEQPAVAREMGAAGRRKLEREWSPARIAEQTMEVYERAAHHAATRASST